MLLDLFNSKCFELSVNIIFLFFNLVEDLLDVLSDTEVIDFDLILELVVSLVELLEVSLVSEVPNVCVCADEDLCFMDC